MDAPVYAFTATSFPYTALVAKVSDQDKLHTSLDIMVKEQICQPIEAADDYSYTRMGQRDIFAFNETTVMLVQTGSTSQMENAQKMKPLKKVSLITLVSRRCKNRKVILISLHL